VPRDAQATVHCRVSALSWQSVRDEQSAAKAHCVWQICAEACHWQDGACWHVAWLVTDAQLSWQLDETGSHEQRPLVAVQSATVG